MKFKKIKGIRVYFRTDWRIGKVHELRAITGYLLCTTISLLFIHIVIIWEVEKGGNSS